MSTRYRFGVLRAASVGSTLRATYTFTPRLTLQTYAQIFLAFRHYSDFSSFATSARPVTRAAWTSCACHCRSLATNHVR